MGSVASAGSSRQHNTEREEREGEEALTGAMLLSEAENPCEAQLTYLFEEDFDIDEEDDSPDDDDEEELASDDEDESDRESVVGEETDPGDALEDIIDQYNSDHSEIMDS